MNRQELVKQIREKQSFLCVGLDTDPKKMPGHIFDLHDPILEFNKAIIDATAPYCVAYKPNLAFYEVYGIHGMTAFKKTVRYLKENYPEIKPSHIVRMYHLLPFPLYYAWFKCYYFYQRVIRFLKRKLNRK